MPSPARLRTGRVRVPEGFLRRGSGAAVVHAAYWPAEATAAPDAPVHVCVHGLGGSHLNWARLGPRLAAHGPVWAPDLAGFGLTPALTRTSSVEDNLDLLAGFVSTVAGDRPALLVGNSMGGHLAYCLAAEHPDAVAGLVLIAPAVPPVVRIPDPVVAARFVLYTTPLLGRAFLERRRRRKSPAQEVAETMALCLADASRLDRDTLDAHVDMAARRRDMPHSLTSLMGASRSLLLRLGPQRAALWAAIERVRAPALLLQGARDRLTEQRACDRLAARRPDWRYVVYDDLGHLVMLEDPDRVAADILDWRRVVLAATG